MFRGAVVWCWAGGTREVWKAVVSPPVSPWNCRTLVRRPEACSVGVVTLITRHNHESACDSYPHPDKLIMESLRKKSYNSRLSAKRSY